MESMLPGAPWLLAHKSMLPVNQPLKVTLYGKDYVLWQEASGTIQALPNVCPHMGAMLSEGWCEPFTDSHRGQSGIVCPFHASNLMELDVPFYRALNRKHYRNCSL